MLTRFHKESSIRLDGRSTPTYMPHPKTFVLVILVKIDIQYPKPHIQEALFNT